MQANKLPVFLVRAYDYEDNAEVLLFIVVNVTASIHIYQLFMFLVYV